VEDFVAAAVFVTALAALFVMAGVTLKLFLPSKIVEAPIAPGKDVPTRHIYVYNHTGSLYAVEYAGTDPEAFRRAVGMPGDLVAVFTVYPGGYNCTRYTRVPVRIGPDPYTGLWCPPPFDTKVEKGCVPVGLTSRGRWLLVQYSCPGTP
jgi:signal peptidase I